MAKKSESGERAEHATIKPAARPERHAPTRTSKLLSRGASADGETKLTVPESLEPGTIAIDLVVGQCTTPCLNDGCEWEEVPHHYLRPGEEVCFSLYSMKSSEGSVEERKVIIKKPSDR